MQVDVSIIMPVFNVEKYLSQCIDSILNQTHKNFELICIDDGSTDNSLKILHEYASKDERVKIYTQKNKYAGVARNSGIRVAKGDYLLFLDSDDFFEKDMLESIVENGSKTQADVIMFGSRKYDDSKQEFVNAPNFFRKDYLCDKEVFNRFDLPDKLLSITTPAPWSKVFKREYILNENIYYQPLQNSNDVYFVLTAIACANKITTIDKVFVNYRVGMSTNLQSTKAKNPTCFLEAFIAVYDELNRRGIYKEIEQSYINAFLFAIAYNLKTIKNSEALHKVYEALANDKIKNIGLLNHDSSYYLREKDVVIYSNVEKKITFMKNDYSQDILKLKESKYELSNTFKDSYLCFKLAMEYLDKDYNQFELWKKKSRNIYIKCKEKDYYLVLDIHEKELFKVHVIDHCKMMIQLQTLFNKTKRKIKTLIKKG